MLTRVGEIVRRAAALAVALALCLPVPAFAGPRGSDRVGDEAAAKRGIRTAVLPDVDMEAGLLVDGEGRVLWSRDADDRRAMASITKIMTSVVALEQTGVDDTVEVPKLAARVGESTSELKVGDELTVRELLEALMVKSGNDAAEAIAVGVAGSEKRFVELMNDKAEALGMTDTHFANPHGLDAKGHYTTAADLGVLARYAMTKPEFRRVVGIKHIIIGTGKRAHRVPNSNALLASYAGANGVKTGWTGDAGYSVIASAQRNGVELYAVVLGTRSEVARFREARELLDWGFAHYRPQTLATAGSVVAEVPVADYLDVAIPVAVSRDTTTAVLDLDGTIQRTVSVEESLRAPVERGQRVGVATYTQRGKVVASVPLVAAAEVARPGLIERMWIGTVRVWRAVFGSGAFVRVGYPL